MQKAGDTESRNPHDTPLSERDCEVFTEFYGGFLRKTEEEKLNLLKGLTLLRQGQRRPFIHSLMAARTLTENIFPSMEERDLLLAFPSMLGTLWNMIMDYRRDHGEEEVAPVRKLVVDHLAQVSHSRDELNRLLEQLRPIPPKDKFDLSITFAKTGKLKSRKQKTQKLLLIILADRPFLCLLPEDTHSTMAIGKLRSYIDHTLGDALVNLQIEFFTVGGCYLKKADQVQVGGDNPIFDVTFDEPTAPFSGKVISQYQNAKFNLLRDILSEEFPNEVFARI